LVESVRRCPFVPAVFGANQRGMQSTAEIDDQEAGRILWLTAAAQAANNAEALAALGVHKQWVNRLLETYLYVTSVVTATEWSNFFHLRAHPDAQPEFQELAYMMRNLYDNSVPQPLAIGEWAMPYIEAEDAHIPVLTRLKVSAARCARTSYKTTDGNRSTIEADIELCDRLIASGHMSPFDHQGVAVNDGGDTRHFVGYVPFRSFVENQTGRTSRKF
jgi:thymidylate synthase ThyX